MNNRAHTHTHVHSYFLVRVIDFIFGAHFRMERLPFYFVAHKLHGRVVVFGVTESFFCAAFFSLLNNILFLSGGYDNAMSLCDVVICKCIVWGVGCDTVPFHVQVHYVGGRTACLSKVSFELFYTFLPFCTFQLVMFNNQSMH